MIKRMMTLAGCLAATACFEPVAPPEVIGRFPFLEKVTVEASYGENGRTFITWSHRDGPNAILGQPGSVRFTSRGSDGNGSVVTVTEPFDTRSPTPNVVEFEYRHGRDLMEIRATQHDATGRISIYECFAPDWTCYRQ